MSQDVRPIRRAIISVFDKTGLDELAKALHGAGVQLISTGGSAKLIADLGIPVTAVEELTGFAECLDGRVKTLHPAVHAGLLADSHNPEHVKALADMGIEHIDLYVGNLYPFTQTVASGASYAECIEQIDIGGPAMLRSAAKNHATVAVVTSPRQYADVIDAVAEGGTTQDMRTVLAVAAFQHVAEYDVAIANWMSEQVGELIEDTTGFAMWRGNTWRRSHVLRYGENPHQQAALYVDGTPGVAAGELLHGKAMSYNNYLDTDAALRAVSMFGEVPACAIIKHLNPCGLAVGVDIAEAHAKAHACDPVSAFGGIIAVNQPVTLTMAQQVKDVFTEVIAAPSFAPEALELLKTKPNLRLLVVDPAEWHDVDVETRSISGGLLVQDVDHVNAEVDGGGDDSQVWTLVAGQAADESTLADLEFAWQSCRPVKSNAIVLVRDGATVGIGMGQVNRVDSCHLAVKRAGAERLAGSVASSDAFFPFPDGLQVLIDAGVKAVVAPGGSVRDEAVIEAAQKAGITLYFTGVRHFAH